MKFRKFSEAILKEKIKEDFFESIIKERAKKISLPIVIERENKGENKKDPCSLFLLKTKVSGVCVQSNISVSTKGTSSIQLESKKAKALRDQRVGQLLDVIDETLSEFIAACYTGFEEFMGEIIEQISSLACIKKVFWDKESGSLILEDGKKEYSLYYTGDKENVFFLKNESLPKSLQTKIGSILDFQKTKSIREEFFFNSFAFRKLFETKEGALGEIKEILSVNRSILIREVYLKDIILSKYEKKIKFLVEVASVNASAYLEMAVSLHTGIFEILNVFQSGEDEKAFFERWVFEVNARRSKWMVSSKEFFESLETALGETGIVTELVMFNDSIKIGIVESDPIEVPFKTKNATLLFENNAATEYEKEFFQVVFDL